MPIRPFLNGERFDDDTVRVMGVAFETVCIALRIGNSADDVRQAIAAKVIGLAKSGERNPDILCELALKEIRTGASDSQEVPSRPLREKEAGGATPGSSA
jgi:hypothetical protein